MHGQLYNIARPQIIGEEKVNINRQTHGTVSQSTIQHCPIEDDNGSKEETETNKNRGLLGWSGRRQLRWGLTSDTDPGIIFFVLMSKLLAQHLLKLNLFQWLGILSSMRLGQTQIVGSRFSNKSYLLVSELPQKFGRVSSPYLNPTEISQKIFQEIRYKTRYM